MSAPAIAIKSPKESVEQAVEWRETPLSNTVTNASTDRYLFAQAPAVGNQVGDEWSGPDVLPTPSQVSPPDAVPPPAEPTPRRLVLPLDQPGKFDGSVQTSNGMVSVAVRQAPLHSVLSLLAKQQGLSIVASSSLTQPVTVTLQPTTLENALDALLSVAGCTWTSRNGVIYVTEMSKDSASSPFFQGREVRVFTLNYAAADDLEKVVTGLLSPVGKVFIRQLNPADNLRTAEQIVVEDLPPFIERVADYIAQADQAPRQVMIEARILQVRLGKDKDHGVNFDALTRMSGARVHLWTKGFADEEGPGMVFTVDGTDFNNVIDCLTNTVDAKTLASPKTLVVNGQQSKIQIGRRLGYFVTTTTQTSTLQDVRFLDVGVVLHVTPTITADGRVLMQVAPKVSSGDINPTTTLPEEETTEVETSVIVPDGHGIIIGGLIQEFDADRQSKLSGLGDLWVVGRLFQSRQVERERHEVIVALLPRIVDCSSCEDADELDRARSPLLEPHLAPAFRPWEPALPDAAHRPLWSVRKGGKSGSACVVEPSLPQVGSEQLPHPVSAPAAEGLAYPEPVRLPAVE
ncbi:Type IV pilus biogenesis and competence protein PilQ precursor [Posidoniimonas corsicana]|uniref:Type IV pilus biogenesis and competence protein PilQ n=2 Tax=Posidoniimonas corsicana TaxID=1938618 RepID=A0A5C5VDW6_9BACT|nr:Type IV pilus biogenesis and competence protein PilQ precursor [Posidoniimonas corsicana]